MTPVSTLYTTIRPENWTDVDVIQSCCDTHEWAPRTTSWVSHVPGQRGALPSSRVPRITHPYTDKGGTMDTTEWVFDPADESTFPSI